jgi:hypothetical protein
VTAGEGSVLERPLSVVSAGIELLAGELERQAVPV